VTLAKALKMRLDLLHFLHAAILGPAERDGRCLDENRQQDDRNTVVASNRLEEPKEF
jgi:hypothetical protein